MSRVEIFIPEKYKDTSKYETEDGIVFTRNETEEGNQSKRQGVNHYVSLAIEKQYQKLEDGLETFECAIPLDIDDFELDCEDYFKDLNLSDDTKLYLEFKNISLSRKEFQSLDRIMEREIFEPNKSVRQLQYKEIRMKDKIGIKKKLVIFSRVSAVSYEIDYESAGALTECVIWSSTYLHFFRPNTKYDLEEIHLEDAVTVNGVLEQMMRMNEEEAWNFFLHTVLPQIHEGYNYEISFYEGAIECGDLCSTPLWMGTHYYLTHEKNTYDVTGFLLNKKDDTVESATTQEEFLERYRFILQKMHDGKIQGFIAKASFMGLIF